MDGQAPHRHRGRPIPKWASTELLIDDVSHPVETCTVGDDRVAVIDLDSAIVGLQSHRIPLRGLSFTQIPDITPYSEGSRQLRGRILNRRPLGHPTAKCGSLGNNTRLETDRHLR